MPYSDYGALPDPDAQDQAPKPQPRPAPKASAAQAQPKAGSDSASPYGGLPVTDMQQPESPYGFMPTKLTGSSSGSGLDSSDVQSDSEDDAQPVADSQDQQPRRPEPQYQAMLPRPSTSSASRTAAARARPKDADTLQRQRTGRVATRGGYPPIPSHLRGIGAADASGSRRSDDDPTQPLLSTLRPTENDSDSDSDETSQSAFSSPRAALRFSPASTIQDTDTDTDTLFYLFKWDSNRGVYNAHPCSPITDELQDFLTKTKNIKLSSDRFNLGVWRSGLNEKRWLQGFQTVAILLALAAFSYKLYSQLTSKFPKSNLSSRTLFDAAGAAEYTTDVSDTFGSSIGKEMGKPAYGISNNTVGLQNLDTQVSYLKTIHEEFSIDMFVLYFCFQVALLVTANSAASYLTQKTTFLAYANQSVDNEESNTVTHKGITAELQPPVLSADALMEIAENSNDVADASAYYDARRMN